MQIWGHVVMRHILMRGRGVWEGDREKQNEKRIREDMINPGHKGKNLFDKWSVAPTV